MPIVAKHWRGSCALPWTACGRDVRHPPSPPPAPRLPAERHSWPPLPTLRSTLCTSVPAARICRAGSHCQGAVCPCRAHGHQPCLPTLRKAARLRDAQRFSRRPCRPDERDAATCSSDRRTRSSARVDGHVCRTAGAKSMMRGTDACDRAAATFLAIAIGVVASSPLLRSEQRHGNERTSPASLRVMSREVRHAAEARANAVTAA